MFVLNTTSITKPHNPYPISNREWKQQTRFCRRGSVVTKRARSGKCHQNGNSFITQSKHVQKCLRLKPPHKAVVNSSTSSSKFDFEYVISDSCFYSVHCFHTLDGNIHPPHTERTMNATHVETQLTSSALQQIRFVEYALVNNLYIQLLREWKWKQSETSTH
jgi:hypothetical protein